jgi:hypothetical protein
VLLSAALTSRCDAVFDLQTVKFIDVQTKYLVAKDDRFNPDFLDASRGFRKRLGELVEEINEVLEEIRSEINYED